jgi:hypothetical protein
MRNSIDQGDEVTRGATKTTLLAGERAQPVPEPGLGKKDGTNTTPRPATAPRRPRPRTVAETSPRPATPAPAPERPSVEVIEGAKKRNVDFPN